MEDDRRRRRRKRLLGKSAMDADNPAGASNYNNSNHNNDVVVMSNKNNSYNNNSREEAFGINMVVDLNIPLLDESDDQDHYDVHVHHHRCDHEYVNHDKNDRDDDEHRRHDGSIAVTHFNNYYNIGRPRPPSSPFRSTRQQISALDQAIEKEIKKNGPTSDVRKLRRTISNRLSAQRSRNKKAQYLSDLEQNITELQEMIAILNPRIENYKSKRGALLIQKATLEQQLHDCMIMSNLCNVEIEKNKREVERLKEVEKMQIREKQMMVSSSFGFMHGALSSSSVPYNMHYHQHLRHHHHPQPPLMSANPNTTGSFWHHLQEPNNNKNNNHIDSAAALQVDQYINFDALN